MTTKKDHKRMADTISQISNAASILGAIGGSRTSPLKTRTSRENGEMSFPYRIYMPAIQMIPPRFRTLKAVEEAAKKVNGTIQRRDPETGEWQDMEKSK